LDAGAGRAFDGVGMVSDAVFTDLDGDGWPELVLACDCGPVRIFKNNQANYKAWDPPVRWAGPGARGSRPSTLDQVTGWWNSVAAGDFDGDGRLDLVAGNWGRNTKYGANFPEPLHLFFGDLDGDGAVELVEAGYDQDLKKVVPWRDWQTLAAAMPFIRERYSSFTAFSTASVSEFLGERLAQMNERIVNTLDTVVFLNRGDHLEARLLPAETQLAPVFGIAVGDLDGDGTEDIFVSQNFFGVSSDASRYDAGCGLWLKGDGRGGFSPVSTSSSGIAIYGEGRGAALCDYDHDGRLDLAVGQNGDATRLFRNVSARPGLRVRLKGPPGNLHGIGTTVRLIYRDGKRGPMHEVHAGGGYWSQESPAVVLGMAAEPEALEIRWPGGKSRTVAVPKGAHPIAVDGNGNIETEP
jgi:hypothetical protein